MSQSPNTTADVDQIRAHDLRVASRHLVRHPLVLAERDPEMFQLIRRHEQPLDRWFTQRFGYRLQVTSDTARLFKTMMIANRRPLFAVTQTNKQIRPMSGREHTLLALALAAASAGASVISLRDLIQETRSAAVEAGVAITEESADRRAFVMALRWMIHHGVAEEMHDRIDRYIDDGDADAAADRLAVIEREIEDDVATLLVLRKRLNTLRIAG